MGPVYNLAEVKKHIKEDDCWIIVHGKVYDVTKFLDEHPGGFDIIISNTGKDATEDFEEIGHSNNARELLKKYEIGEYELGDVQLPSKSKLNAVRARDQGTSPVLKLLQVLLPLVVLLAAVYLPKMLSAK